MIHKDIAKTKKATLIQNLKDLGPILIAFSGGVDSSFLLAVSHDVLGDKVMAATSNSVIHPLRETENATDFARTRGICHILFRSKEMDLKDFVENKPDRCYQCKRQLFQMLFEIAREHNITKVIHGANLDDLRDHRPGFKAAIEAGVRAPLIDAQLGKDEIRFLSKEMGLTTWNKPPESCLATRIPYGDHITENKIRMIDEAELIFFEMGVREFRVRHHGSLAMIEIGRDVWKKILDEVNRKNIVDRLRAIGFDHIALDLEGHVSGSLNRALTDI